MNWEDMCSYVVSNANSILGRVNQSASYSSIGSPMPHQCIYELN